MNKQEYMETRWAYVKYLFDSAYHDGGLDFPYMTKTGGRLEIMEISREEFETHKELRETSIWQAVNGETNE